MRNLHLLICFFFVSFFSFSQQKNEIAEIYLVKAKKSFSDNDLEKSEKYFQKATVYFGGILTQETAIFGGKLFVKKKEYVKAKKYIKAFFDINKNKESETYKEMLFLFTEVLDNIGDENVFVTKKLEAQISVKKDSVTTNEIEGSIGTYEFSKQLFDEKKYKESLASLDAYFASKPDKSSELYQNMILLLVKVRESKESNSETNVVELPIDEEESEEGVDLTAIEEVPVFPGCKGSNQELKDCFSAMLQKHFVTKYNPNLPNSLGLSSGKKRVLLGFKIDVNGSITDVSVSAPHPKIESEVIRIIQELPKMKPGTQNGKPVGVTYSIPFTIVVE